MTHIWAQQPHMIHIWAQQPPRELALLRGRRAGIPFRFRPDTAGGTSTAAPIYIYICIYTYIYIAYKIIYIYIHIYTYIFIHMCVCVCVCVCVCIYVHSIRQRMLRLYTQHTLAYASSSFPPRLRQYSMWVSICTYVLVKQVNWVPDTSSAS